MSAQVLLSINTLVAVLFLLTAFMLISARQAQAVLYLYVAQGVLLAASAVLLAVHFDSPDLLIVAAITIAAKPIAIPLLINRLLSPALRRRRELSTAVGIPTALIIALLLSVVAYAVARPLVAGQDQAAATNLSIGLVVSLLGVFLLAIRHEALPQLFALMTIDNGVFFAGIAITTSSALVEFAAALEGVMVVMIVALLARTIALTLGSTDTSTLDALRERYDK
jgi:hydrogenase-4 component E